MTFAAAIEISENLGGVCFFFEKQKIIDKTPLQEILFKDKETKKDHKCQILYNLFIIWKEWIYRYIFDLLNAF